MLKLEAGINRIYTYEVDDKNKMDVYHRYLLFNKLYNTTKSKWLKKAGKPINLVLGHKVFSDTQTGNANLFFLINFHYIIPKGHIYLQKYKKIYICVAKLILHTFCRIFLCTIARHERPWKNIWSG